MDENNYGCPICGKTMSWGCPKDSEGRKCHPNCLALLMDHAQEKKLKFKLV